MLTNRKKEWVPERKNPGDSELVLCSPGSIEQQLDMCEEGSLRGDEIERHTAGNFTPNDPPSGDPLELTEDLNSFQVTMAERDREGDDLSGDEHSSGLQGEEPELENQPNIDSGVPGDQTRQPFASKNVIHVARERKKIRRRNK